MNKRRLMLLIAAMLGCLPGNVTYASELLKKAAVGFVYKTALSRRFPKSRAVRHG